MPQLPSDVDYGGRPGLDVSRLDRPSDSGIGLADDVMRAATDFKSILDDKQRKEDQLNYALARNEITQMDLEERSKLANDLDYQTHDQRYSAGFAKRRDDISERYSLSPSDATILDSEANLIYAQGRVQVGGRARELEVDEARGRYLSGKAQARETIILADPGTRNRMVLGQLEAIDAQEREGYLSPEEAASEREEMTQDFAMASLDAMPPDERYRVISTSLRYRKGYGSELGDYSQSFVEAADRTGLPAGLLHAVASRESSLDPSAVNIDTGAAGMMQLMEGTAKDVGVTDRMNADQSIQGGADYLNQQFRRFEDLQKALAAYNWGPKNVQDAVDEYGEDWLSHAPEETRDYVTGLVDAWDADIKTNGVFTSGAGALTPADIEAGLGTGSIADFLHADTAAKMLEIAGKEDKTNRQRESAQDVVNAAWRLYPEDHAKRMDWINRNSEGSVQNLAEEDARQRNNDEKNAKSQASNERYEDFSRQMETEGLRFNQIPTEELAEMEARHIQALEKRSNDLSYGQQWPAVTQWAEPDDGRMSMAEWNDMNDYGVGGKTDQNLDTPLFYNSFTESDWNKLKSEQGTLQALESSRITTGELTPRAMVNNALQRMQFTVDDDKGDDKLNGIKARLESELRRRILQQQNSTTPATEIDEAAKNKILAEVLTPYAFTDTDFFTTDYDLTEATPVWLMTAKQREEAFINLDKANQQTMIYEGVELNVEQILRKIGNDNGVRNPTDHNLRRAAFAFMNRVGADDATNMAEVVNRLKGE